MRPEAGVPLHLRAGLRRYLEAGIPPGAFLKAVLENDLRDAVTHGDEASLAGLVPLVRYLYHEVPHECWGSPGAVEAWMAWRSVNPLKGGNA